MVRPGTRPTEWRRRRSSRWSNPSQWSWVRLVCERTASRRGSVLAPAALPQFARTIAHLRDVLGDNSYESLARKGETMTTAAMVNYAYDQIDQARAELNAVSK